MAYEFDEEESNLNIDELKKLSSIYDRLQNEFNYLCYDSVEYISKPIRDLLLANGVNVDDETDI